MSALAPSRTTEVVVIATEDGRRLIPVRQLAAFLCGMKGTQSSNSLATAAGRMVTGLKKHQGLFDNNTLTYVKDQEKTGPAALYIRESHVGIL